MNGFIMAAGFGTRLEPFTHERPKPLFPAGNSTFLDRSALFVKECGVERAVINTHHLPAMIKEHVTEARCWGMDVTVIEEERILGTGGGTRNAAAHLPHDDLLIVAADVAFDIDPRALLAAHRSSDAAATIAVATQGDVETYGGLWVAGDGRVNDIAGLLDRKEGRLIVNASAYIVDARLLDRLPGPGGCLVRDFLVPLLRDGVPISAHVHDGFWAESGTLDLLLDTNLALLAGENTHVDHEAIIESGVVVGPGVVVSQGCRLGAGSRISRSVLLPGAVVTDGEELDYTVRSERHSWRRRSVEIRS